MITVVSLRDLDPFGIIALTGEADALGMRVLCDLTHRGRSIVAEWLGIQPTGFPLNWNSQAIASCLLDPYVAPSLAVIAGVLTNSDSAVNQPQLGGKTVVLAEGSYGRQIAYILTSDEALQRDEDDGHWRLFFFGGDVAGQPWPDVYGKIVRVFRPPGGPGVDGLRNVHQMSGRTA